MPIHVISGKDKTKSVMSMGASGITEKPAERAALVEVFRNLRGEAEMLKPRKRRKNVEASAAPTRSMPELAGAKVLIVDDDIRNIFSLTSVLESYDVEVLHAERGKEGIRILENTGNIDAALIDIMMPEMDGYETMRQIRRRPALANLPLIAVTAKAMKGDRQKCIEAGAWDYLSKPVDTAYLLMVLRGWLCK